MRIFKAEPSSANMYNLMNAAMTIMILMTEGNIPQ